LERLRGGQIAVADGKVLAVLPLPIAGLVTDQPLPKAVKLIADLNAAARVLGCDLAAPFMTMSFLALSPIPELKLTDQALTAEDSPDACVVHDPARCTVSHLKPINIRGEASAIFTLNRSRASHLRVRWAGNFKLEVNLVALDGVGEILKQSITSQFVCHFVPSSLTYTTSTGSGRPPLSPSLQIPGMWVLTAGVSELLLSSAVCVSILVSLPKFHGIPMGAALAPEGEQFGFVHVADVVPKFFEHLVFSLHGVVDLGRLAGERRNIVPK
jgi:Adenine deaminase C-terminal domain